ncbi:MAG: two-component regulator propeller domain-containing protein [Rikenellaceae bacterium]
MRSKYYNILALIIIFLSVMQSLLARSIESQQKILSQTESVGIANGLSNNDATTLYRDSRGYLWIATYDGLNCYNGHVVTTYKNSRNDKFLPSNRIRAINEDSQGRLWIGTDEGLVVYDYDCDDFIIGEGFDKGGIIRDVEIVGNLIYAVSESRGVLVYNMQLNYIDCDYPSGNHVFNQSIVCDNSLLIASSNGVVEYNIADRRFIDHLKEAGLYVNDIIFSSKPHTIYAGTTAGLVEVNVAESLLGELELSIVDQRYETAKIKCLAEDQDGNILIGSTFDGFFYDLNNEVNEATRERYLRDNRMSDFLVVDNGDIWATTFNSGVFRFSSDADVFKSPQEERGLKMTLLNFIDDDRLIIKSEEIIHLYNTKSGRYEKTPDALQQLFSNNEIRHWVDSQQRVWVISHEGCSRYDFKTDKAEFIGTSPLLTAKTTPPTAVSQDSDGNIWLGYIGDMLKLYVDENEMVTHGESILDNNYFKNRETRRVRVIYHDEKTKSTWLGTDLEGLFILPTAQHLPVADIEQYTHDITNQSSLSSNFISTVMRDNNDVMWIGTEQGGLCRVDEGGERLLFKYYIEEHGLSNSVVKAILCGSDELLWIATNVGLNSFDPANEQFHSYRVADGLPFDEFLYSSAASKDGELFFTGINKFIYFDPEALPKDEALPQLYFSDLKIYDQTIKPNVPYENRVIINRRLKSGDSFTLEHDQNSFSIAIDAIYDKNTSYHHYYYILEPVNSKWNTTHVSNNVISFNGLQPGKYTLRVMASNSYGAMTAEKQLYIRIKRPLLGSVVAYIIYSLLLLAVIASIVYFMMHTQALRHKLSLEAQEKESLRVANLEKQRYFSNISHELKTPLTLIVAPLAILADRFRLDLNIKANLAIMQRQVRKMLQLIDLAHGIQLSDEHLLTLKKERFLLRDLLQDISEDFEFLAKFDKKLFKVEYPGQALNIVADRGMVEKILNNLLNNAFKYTVANDTITVSYSCDCQMLILKVSDSGAGIMSEDLPRIFERFYTSKSIETKKVGGTGIGLAFSKHLVELHGGILSVESEYGKGTTFTVEMPIVESQNEINENSQSDDAVDQRSLILGSLELDSEIEVDAALGERLVYMVEDNGEMRAFISEIISRYFKVKSFASARECLSAMETQWPDIIVSDVMMPEMDGDKMCEIIKSDLKTSHIPIILLTARYSVDDKIKGIELGADSYIGKPFYPKHLITRISSLLKGRQRLYEQFQKGLPFIQSSDMGGVSERDSELLSSLYLLFDMNLDNDEVELDSFALELGMNRSLFYSKIKALTDMSPYELLKNYRLQQAHKLILSGQYNINEVCDMTGFKSRTHFSRVFKQHFGISPSKARAKRE